MKRKWLTFRTDEKTEQEIKRIAKADKRSISNVLQLAIEQYIGRPK